MFQVCKRILLLGLIGVFLVACGDEGDCDVLVDFIDQLDGTNIVLFHDTSANEKIAQKFMSEGSTIVGEVSFSIRKVGDPQGEIRISIHEVDGSRPDQDFIPGGGPQGFDASNISSDSFTQVKVEYQSEPDLDSNRDHFLVIDFTGDLNGLDYFELAASSGPDAYPQGEAWLFNSDEDDEDDAWIIRPNTDLVFTIDRCESVG